MFLNCKGKFKKFYLQFGVFIHHDGDHPDVRQETLGPADHIFGGEPQLAGSVEASVINSVVVSFCEKFHCAILPVKLD